MKKCTTYFEENEVITYENYENVLAKLQIEVGIELNKDIQIRKAVFQSAHDQFHLKDNQESVKYSICMKNFKPHEIFLEKRTVRDSMVFKSYISISKKAAEKILGGQIEWMNHDKDGLLHDFYLECKFNDLHLSAIMDTGKDVCSRINGLDGIVLKHSIRSIGIRQYQGQFFDQRLPMVDMLNCDRILISYRRYIHIPQAVSNIVHMKSGTTCEVAYSL